MRRALALFPLLALLAACGGGTAQPPREIPPHRQEAEATTYALERGVAIDPDINQHDWLLGIDSPKETITYLYAEKFAVEVDRLSGGRMRIDIYADGALGGDMALVEACKRNSVTFVVQNTAPQVNFMPELAVFDLPVVYQDIADVRRALDQPAFLETIGGIYRSGGLQLMGFADQTFRVLSSNKKIVALADFDGQSIRTMENPFHMAFWQALGAAPVSMPFGELHTALQQNFVSGQENPYAVIVANQFYKVQDYIMQTNHLPHIISLVTNLEEYQSLTPSEQEILRKAVAVAKTYAREQADLWESEKISELRAAGTEIVPISDTLFAEIRAAAQPIYDQIAEKVGEELVDAYLGR